jgi:signal transduction histidine kinase/CHASE2 domain-containing sensor protein
MLKLFAIQKLRKFDRQTQSYSRFRRFAEWLVCTLIVLLSAAYFDANSILYRLDNVFYDRLLVLGESKANQDIVIVGVDDLSLAKLGNWPIPREYLADMLNQIAKAKPRAVAINLPLSAPGATSASDDSLVDALSQPALGKVFLSLAMEPIVSEESRFSVTPPLGIFANAVTGLGHVNTIMAVDGVTRSFRLHELGNKQIWPSLALQMFSVTHGSNNPAIEPPSLFLTINELLAQSEPSSLVFIPFAGAANRFATVPLIDILHGSVPTSKFAGKLVLVGITAHGIEDRFATPHTRHKLEMPSIAVTASILEGMLAQKLLRPLSTSTTVLLNSLLLTAWMSVLLWSGPRASLLALLFSNIVALGISTAMMSFSNVLWPFSSFWICSMIGYILWSWRRVTFMFMDLQHRAQELKFFSPTTLVNSSTTINAEDTKKQDWKGIMTALDEGLLMSEIGRQEVIETLRAMPEALLLVDSSGLISMANSKAHALLNATSLVNQPILPLIMPMPQSSLGEALWEKFMVRVTGAAAKGLELKTPHGSYVLLRATTIRSLRDQAHQKGLETPSPWYILTLVDVSELRRLQSQHNDMLQLLWHDLRAPQTTILSLLRLWEEHDQSKQMQQRDIKSQIATQVEATLNLANDLVWKMRSEAEHYEFAEIDMIQVMHEVLDRSYPLAHAKSIQLAFELPALIEANYDEPHDENKAITGEHGIWLKAEPKLMGRALYNLVENAIKYSPNASTITISMSLNPAALTPGQDHQSHSSTCVQIIIQDQGLGISEEELPHILKPYFQSAASNKYSQNHQGHGLGLSLVNSVIDAHHGTLRCESTPRQGTTFTIELPIL